MKNSLKILILILIVFMFSGCIDFDDQVDYIHNATINNDFVNTKKIKKLLDFCELDKIYEGNGSYSNESVKKYVLTYINDNNDTIVISLFGDLSNQRSALQLNYKSDIYRIVSESTLEVANNSKSLFMNNEYDAANVWNKFTEQTTINLTYFDITVDHYTLVTEFPIFYGNWKIDEDSSTRLGKRYFSNILFASGH